MRQVSPRYLLEIQIVVLTPDPLCLNGGQKPGERSGEGAQQSDFSKVFQEILLLARVCKLPGSGSRPRECLAKGPRYQLCLFLEPLW